MDLQIGLLRRVDGLFRLVSRPGPDYAVLMQPLSDGELVTIWGELAAVSEFGPATLARVLRILLETRPEWVEGSVLSALPGPILRPRASAAHPRAYRGTRKQPPKAALAEHVNLQPYLLSRRGTHLVLLRLVECWAGGLALLRGFEIHRLRWPLRHPDPFLAYHFPDRPERLEGLPRWLDSELVSVLRTRPTAELLAYRELFYTLQLQRRRRLASAITRLASRTPQAPGWCRLLERLSSRQRLPFLDAVLQSRLWTRGPEVLPVEELEQFRLAESDLPWKTRCLQLTRSLRNGMSPAFFLAGRHFKGWRSWRETGDCPNFDLGYAKQVQTLLPDRGTGSTIWDHSAIFPELLSLFKVVELVTLPVREARAWFDFIVHAPLYSDVGKIRHCRFIGTQLSTLLALYRTLAPDYRVKFLNTLRYANYGWEEPELVEFHLPRTLPFYANLCRPPFSTRPLNCDAAHLLAPRTDWPDASLLALEKACRLDTTANLVRLGFETFFQAGPEFVQRCFEHSPRPFLRVCKLLGGLLRGQRGRVIAEFLQHPLALAREDSPLVELIETHCPRTAAHRKAGCTGPHRQRTLDLCRLDLLTDRIEDVYHGDLGLERGSDAVLLALRTIQSMRSNRKQIRRFLRALAAGDAGWVDRQPATRRWVARRLELDLGLWRRGVEWSDPVRKIRISVESDPLEVLKMGTYVASCLALGGDFADSAAATVLDANRNVLFARDEGGGFVARQRVSLADNNRLVCGPVYPTSASRDLRWAFRDYDRRFAQALGVDLGGDEDPISLLVAEHCYDDAVWDFELD